MIAKTTKATESQNVHFDGVCKSMTIPPLGDGQLYSI
jgi:hypothetical protein